MLASLQGYFVSFRWFTVAFAMALAVTSGCRHDVVKPPLAKPPEVVVAPAVMKDVVDYEDFTGSLEAFRKVEITSRVTGYLEKVNFKEGAKVKENDVLFLIDSRPAQAELDKADAAVVQAQARFTRLDGDLQRAQDLLRSRSISKEEYEKVAGERDEAKAAVGVAVAGRKSAKLMFDYTKVHSPIDGIAGRAMLDEGNLVKADVSTLTTVVTREPMYAYFDVDERTLLRLRRLVGAGTIQETGNSNVKVSMALADEDGFPHVGEVDFEDNMVDPTTGTQRLRGVFKNANGFLTPGMFVRIRFQVGAARKALVVPEQGVGTDQSQKFVYVVNSQDEVEYRKVKTGPLEKGLRVVEEGLQPGDRIVVSGLQRIRPMAKVSPRQEDAPAAKAHELPVANLPANGVK